MSSEESYLSRALGVNPQIEIDYRMLKVEAGDVFVLATDGVAEHVGARFVAGTIRDNADDLDRAAGMIVQEAFRNDSPDNLTVQIVRIDEVPHGEASELFGQAPELPLPPLLEARMVFDGYRIVRELHSSSRSHIYLAVDTDNDTMVVLKIPSIDLRGDPAYLKRFMMEEWVARRINSAHVLKPCPQSRKRNHLYVAMEFIEGQTLKQWIIDNPRPDLETIRGIVEQIARGLQAFHRMEMLHQDLRPDNIMIDKTGTVKIIDFGSTRVRGVIEAAPSTNPDDILGTMQYTAPEYFLGESGSSRSDVFSLGVIAYQMLTGRLPYGAEVAKARTKSRQRKLRYASALDDDRALPAWIDEVLNKAVHPDPTTRYEEPSELAFALRHPDKDSPGHCIGAADRSQSAVVLEVSLRVSGVDGSDPAFHPVRSSSVGVSQNSPRSFRARAKPASPESRAKQRSAPVTLDFGFAPSARPGMTPPCWLVIRPTGGRSTPTRRGRGASPPRRRSPCLCWLVR